eukprot:TRINITY_DN3937_c0_g1_i1.p1 TRINITY_DN3937_c0_g1~~TRINITY_DN3937_c0_g1_i1.p1  ORF type:complete len:227 (-),score=33.79 TRINITY_DN3937_c0_g1_i1:59-739(-)
MSSDNKVVIAYWDIRGLANPVRFILEYTKTPYVDKQYVAKGSPGNWDVSDWLNDKEKLGLDFPNLPYLIDGDLKVTQSNTILRYLGNKNGLSGKDNKEKAIVDMLGDVAMDFRNEIIKLVYNRDFKDLVGNFEHKTVPNYFSRLSTFLGDKKWFIGDNLTWPDFVLFELFDQTRLMVPHAFDSFPRLANFVKRFESIPEISEYLKSDRAVKRVNNRMAAWGAEPIN